ncbi:MAG: hypothetical protein E7164_04935 [Firmicutes bacterium]|nr:hypothetical protein [Bacillota bacterium]
MLEIEKNINTHGYEYFTIETDDGKFQISFENNLDLYWRPLTDGCILDLPTTQTYYITKENYELYQIFYKLYKRITMGNPFDGVSELNYNNQIYYTLSPYNPQKLVENNKICWYSDDFIYENASLLTIEFTDDEFVITFQKSKLPYDDGLLMTYSIRFRNSGSRYHPFNIPFMQMYNELKEYNYEYHQISIEELLYEPKKRTLTKKIN